MHGKNQPPPKRKRNKTSASNQVKLDAKRPIPFENNSQVFSFINQSAYLPFLPPLDDFARQLLECRLLSATHNACVTTKKDYCAGQGFHDAKGTELDKRIVEWFKSMNLKNLSATKINKNVFEDKFTYGNVPIEVVRFTVAGDKKLFVYPHSFLEWRLCKPDDDGVIRSAIQSKLFLREGYITSEMLKLSKKLPVYNPHNTEKENWLKDKNGVERTLIWYKNSVTGFEHYGVPSALSSMIFQLLEYKGARYNLDEFDNNMVVASILALKGTMTDAEANKIAKRIIDQHSGDGKRGRTVVVNSEEGSVSGSELHKLDTHKDGSFTEADNGWTQKIILANQWDAILAGIVSPSTLGKGSGFLTKIQELKFKTVIKPEQDDIMDEVWSYIFEIATAWLGFDFDRYEMAIKNNIDISGLTDVDITPAVTVDEVRTSKGLPQAKDKKKGGMFLGELKGKQQATDPKKEKEEEDV